MGVSLPQNYVPEVSALDTTATPLEVDPDTKVRYTPSLTHKKVVLMKMLVWTCRTSSAPSEWTASTSPSQHPLLSLHTLEEEVLQAPVDEGHNSLHSTIISKVSNGSWMSGREIRKSLDGVSKTVVDFLLHPKYLLSLFHTFSLQCTRVF